MSFGNKIIAENVFSVISPIFGKTYSVIHNNLDSAETSVVYAMGADLSGKNFDNLNLQSAIFDKANLSNTNFKNADVDRARFAFANLTGADLSDTNFTGTILIGANLSGTNFTGTILKGADLTDAIITGVISTGADLENAVLTYTILNCEGDLKDKTGIQVLQCYIAMLTQSCKFWIFHLCN